MDTDSHQVCVIVMYGHFGPTTFRHSCRGVHWTFRHRRKNPRHFGTTYNSYTEVSH